MATLTTVASSTIINCAHEITRRARPRCLPSVLLPLSSESSDEDIACFTFCIGELQRWLQRGVREHQGQNHPFDDVFDERLVGHDAEEEESMEYERGQDGDHRVEVAHRSDLTATFGSLKDLGQGRHVWLDEPFAKHVAEV